MYRCQITGRNSREGAKLNKVIIETRSVQYKHWDEDEEKEWFTNGIETVKEVNASKDGVDIWNSWSELEKQQFVAAISKKRNY
jgi:hypothetical protein